MLDSLHRGKISGGYAQQKQNSRIYMKKMRPLSRPRPPWTGLNRVLPSTQRQAGLSTGTSTALSCVYDNETLLVKQWPRKQTQRWCRTIFLYQKPIRASKKRGFQLELHHLQIFYRHLLILLLGVYGVNFLMSTVWYALVRGCSYPVTRSHLGHFCLVPFNKKLKHHDTSTCGTLRPIPIITRMSSSLIYIIY